MSQSNKPTSSSTRNQSERHSGKKRYSNSTNLILVNEVIFSSANTFDGIKVTHSLKPRLINASRIIDVEFSPNYYRVHVNSTPKRAFFNDEYPEIGCSLIHLAGRSHEDRIAVIETPEEIYNLIKEA